MSNQNYIVEASAGHVVWFPIQTNRFAGFAAEISDAGATNLPQRFLSYAPRALNPTLNPAAS